MSSSLAVSTTNSLSGPDKAAAFLLLAGKEAATALADYFSEEELRAVFVAAERLQSLTVDEMQALVEEFRGEFVRNGMVKTQGSVESLFSDIRPGLDFDEFLSGPVAPKKKKKKVPDTPTWTQVAEMGPESVGEFIREQHPQTCAFVLSRIDQTFAARVLNDLPDELCSAIVLRLVEISPIEHPVTAEVEKLILRSFSHKQESEPDGDALERVAGVVNELTVERADKIVEMLRVNDEAKADLIRKFLFRFEGIEALERQDRAILFDGWPAEEIAQALLGVSDSMKEGILDVLSQRTRRSVENEMTDNKATEEEILDTRRRIAKRAVALSREGRIRMAASE